MKTIDASELCRLLTCRSRGTRVLAAIAGPPGSGKSTLAEAIVAQINDAEPGRAAVLPMDGYHFDDALLVQLGRKERKGAPDTFDVPGLRQMLTRLRGGCEEAVAVPVFDRGLEISRAAARFIPPLTDIIVVEGNYLLLRLPPWHTLKPLFDLTVMMDVPEATLRQRLTARWQGFSLPPAEVSRKVEQVDLPNGVLVQRESSRPDYVIPTLDP